MYAACLREGHEAHGQQEVEDEALQRRHCGEDLGSPGLRPNHVFAANRANE